MDCTAAPLAPLPRLSMAETSTRRPVSASLSWPVIAAMDAFVMAIADAVRRTRDHVLERAAAIGT